LWLEIRVLPGGRASHAFVEDDPRPGRLCRHIQFQQHGVKLHFRTSMVFSYVEVMIEENEQYLPPRNLTCTVVREPAPEIIPADPRTLHPGQRRQIIRG
jgi:hypothetical protein